jgi:anaerobic selenocysteine-containing dehydrogenase
VAGLAATIGRGAMSNPLVDMEKPDVIFCIGTNMTEAHPVAATRLKKALRHGAKLIVADPRRIPLAEKADVYLPLRVGSDVALLGAMAHVIVREGLVDREFLAARTENFEVARRPRLEMAAKGHRSRPASRSCQAASSSRPRTESKTSMTLGSALCRRLQAASCKSWGLRP